VVGDLEFAQELLAAPAVGAPVGALDGDLGLDHRVPPLVGAWYRS
jgi:hypothetical protein